MRLLFTGGGGAGNEAIWRQFNDRHDLFFADADPGAIDPLIPAGRRFAIPFARKPDFADRVLSLCERERIDILVPGVDEELVALADRRGTVATRILVPSADFVKLMLDKLSASKAILDAGLTVPETRPLLKFEGMSFPLIAKPRTGRGSRGVEKLDRSEQVAAYLTMQKGDPDFYVAQALCPGQEYTVFACADEEGRLRSVIPVRVISKKGITIRAVIEHQPSILEYTKRFQNHFKPANIYNIQCMLNDRGVVYPFEVNPRISTTFCLAVSTGFDPFSLRSQGDGIFVPTKSISLARHWRNIIE